MTKLHGSVWITVGLLVGGTSLFTGYITPVDKPAFFKFMTFIGFGMVIYGILKINLNRKPKEQVHNPQPQGYNQHTQNHSNKYHVNNQQIHNNPQYRQDVMHQGHRYHPASSRNHNYNNHSHNMGQQQSNQNVDQPVKKNFCHNCGVPLYKGQKVCAMCNSKL